MKVQSTLYDRISGSIGKITGQQGRGGSYLKTKSNPRNPNTARQQVIRISMAAANIAWRAGTQAQRDAWQEYGATCTYENNTGTVVALTGWNAYSRVFVIKSQAGQATDTLINQRPAQNGYEPSALVELSENDTVATTLDVMNGSTAATDINIYAGGRTNQTVNAFSGSFQFLTNETIASKAVFEQTTALVSGRNWFRIQTIGTDGRAGKGFVTYVDVA